MIARLLTALALSLAPLAASAQQACTEDAMVVFDGSGSMSEMGLGALGQPRIFEAREAMARAMPQIAALRRVGLIVYGPGNRASCHNIDLRFPPRSDAAPALIDAVNGLRPSGNTPLTESIRAAADVLKARDRPGTIVLVTDGKETCGGAPCALAEQLAAEAPNLTVHVIGFRSRIGYGAHSSVMNAASAASCLAERTGGHFVDTQSVDQLVQALHVTLGCPVYGAAGGLRGQSPMQGG